MNGKIRLSQLYELQRVALMNVHYYGDRIEALARFHRPIQIVAALAAALTSAAVFRSLPEAPEIVLGASVVAAIAAATLPVFNLSGKLEHRERMHAGYKMLYHSAENLAKQTIGQDALTTEQHAVLCALEQQLAALGPQDEIHPNKGAIKKARQRVEQELPNSCYYPQNA